MSANRRGSAQDYRYSRLHTRRIRVRDFGARTLIRAGEGTPREHLPMIGDFTFGAGVLFFPISYVFGDILTEVYGYARARRVIWSGLTALVFASIMATSWSSCRRRRLGRPGALRKHLRADAAHRVASINRVFCGEFANSYTLAKMKIWTKGKAMWSRVHRLDVSRREGVDSLVFYACAFLGVWEPSSCITVMSLELHPQGAVGSAGRRR
jgi:uncharacterized PurR-regulated membrane protein YhhQ (DUF165 family)